MALGAGGIRKAKDLKRFFLSAAAKLSAKRDRLLKDCAVMRDALADNSAINLEIQRCSDEMEILTALARQLIEKTPLQR